MNISSHVPRLLVLLLATALIEGCGNDAPPPQSGMDQHTAAPPVVTTVAPAASGTEDADAVAPPASPAATSTQISAGSSSLTEATSSVHADVAEPSDESVARAVDSPMAAQHEETAERTVELVPTAAQVRLMQKALREAGYDPGAVDGKLGPRTLSALERYQQQNGLAVGAVTEETLSALQQHATR